MGISVQLRRRWRYKFAPIGFGALVFASMPGAIGFQDLGALLARQPGVAERWRAHLIASPFGTIHAAMFSLTKPVGTAIPHPPVYALANFDPMRITGAIGAMPLGDLAAPRRFPTANRKSKRDSLLARAREPLPPLPPSVEMPRAEADVGLKPEDLGSRFDPYSDYEFGSASETEPTTVASDRSKPGAPRVSAAIPEADKTALKGAARVFFGVSPLAPEGNEIARWAPGEAPVVLASNSPDDLDLKRKPMIVAPLGDLESGESVANKGQVTGADQQLKSPAERLGFTGEARAKHEKCLADAIYFESRGEAVRGQIAVAQVVINRVFAPFYPKTVCDVVYQNAHRRNACQFSFACDGIPDVVTEPDAWARAKRIAHDMLDGKLWLAEVGKSTHYHAYWVRPSWVAEMKRLYKFGVHTFYRPRNWGDGSDEPSWEASAATAEAANKF